MTCLVRIEGPTNGLDPIDFGNIASCAIRISDRLDLSCNYIVDLRFVSAKDIRAINKQTRSVDKPTDVLSFPSMRKPAKDKRRYAYDDETGMYFLGDIIICTEVASNQAIEYGHSQKREVSYLFTHGVCHLLGYDHKRKSDKLEMRALEENALKAVNNG
ncbi:MAG: rRNA maturation RNase YbeY [Oscillospiraceae bacterium]|jgi:probable rRNA maturation factor|nr:rRNA maturation RNase YbeY [Oscillospiraceae bacterium]